MPRERFETEEHNMPLMNFPSRADRLKLLEELRRLEQEQGKNFTGKELYEAYKQAFLALDRRMEPLYAPDGQGLPPDLTAKDKQELSELMLQAGMAGEQYLAAWMAAHRGEDPGTGLPGMVQQLQRLMNKDFDALSLYDPAKPQTLPEIQENARTKTIDLRGRNFKKLGNMQNARMLMTLHGANGKPRTGVFTKATHVRVKGRFQEILDRAKSQCGPEGAAELDQFLSNAKKYFFNIGQTTRDGRAFPQNASDDLTVGIMLNDLRTLTRMHDKEAPTTQIVKDYLAELQLDLNKISGKAIKTLRSGLAELTDHIPSLINSYSLQLQDGERLDNRNSAMSAVADLLGIGDRIARSENMRFIDDEGKTVEGSFMEFGKGLDLNAHPEDSVFLNFSPRSNENTKNQLLKSIADLQILDHLCLNVDRHQGNLMYQVDKEGNLIGVQGIDNDSSFGARIHMGSDFESLKVISKSMVNKLEGLTPEMMRFALRGRGLSEAEIQLAGHRLDRLKTKIKQGAIRTVQDDKFGALDPKDYLYEKGNGNLFAMVRDQIDETLQYRRENNLPFKPLLSEEPPEMAKVPVTERKYTVAGMVDASDRVGRLLDNRETGFRVRDLTGIRGSSENFKNMVAAAQKAAHLPEYLNRQQKLDPGLPLRDKASKESTAAFDDAFEKLRSTTTAYLKGKMQQRGASSLETLRGKNSYEQARIDYAKKLLNTVSLYEKLRKGPQTEEEKAEEQSLIDRRAIEARRAAQKQGQEAQRQPDAPRQSEPQAATQN